MAGPAIVASNATVVLALLTLLFASTPSTRSLGTMGACGLVVAAVAVLVVLPPVLALFGRRLFWPFIPRPDDGAALDSGPWHRVAEWVARRPALVSAIAVALLAVLATGLLGTRIGLSQTKQFRVRADSVSGYDVVAAHFPAGMGSPTLVVAPSDQAEPDPPGDRFDPRRGLGVGGGTVDNGADELVRRHRRPAIIGTVV